MKTLFIFIFLTSLQSFAENCSLLPDLVGSWTLNVPTQMTIRNNAQDPVALQCKKTHLTITESGEGFKIEKCYITDCDDGSTFLCETDTLKIVNGKIIDETGKNVGTCNSTVLKIERDMDQMSWKNWHFSKETDQINFKLEYNYWNLGTIESSVIPLK